MHMTKTTDTKAPSETPIWDAAYDAKRAARDALMDAVREHVDANEAARISDLVFNLEMATRVLAGTPQH